ncbi:MAG TPA: lipoprotein insertase outer membrane protein LolB [Gammaproteobacteria bacterium]
MTRLFPMLLALVLAGCAVEPPRQPASSRELAWQERQAALKPLQHWQLTGRLAIQTGDDGWNATLIWRQEQERYKMQLVAPLGQGSLQLEGDNQQVELRTSEGNSAVAADPDTLILTELGWRVPVSALRYWVLGLTAPGAASVDIDEFGRLRRLKQAGWEVEFLDYTLHGDTELPARLFVNNHQAQVRLVIKRWELGDASAR